MVKVKKLLYRLFNRSIAIILFLALWEIAPRIGWVDSVFLPPFSVIVSELFTMVTTGELFHHILISLIRSALGFSLGMAIAIPLGLIIGWFKRFENLIDPLLQLFRQTPILALFPVFILFFGIGEISKIGIILWGTLWAILLNTIAGVKSVDPLLIKAARSMGASQFTIFTKVVIQAAFPQIFTGIRLSATISLLILTVAEMMGANSGLGFLLYDSQTKYLIPRMYVAIITMSILGFVLNYLLVEIEKRVNHWKENIPVGTELN